MLFGNKTAIIAELCLRMMAPCAINFLKHSNHPLVTGMDAGKKDVLISLLGALNGPDSLAKKAMKEAQVEIEKIQGSK